MRTIDIQNIDEWLFDYFEGNLTTSEQESLKNFLHKNPSLKADFEAWKGSFVKEPEIIYPEVNKLLQPEKQTQKWKWIASSILLLFVIATVLYYSIPSEKQIIAPQEPKNTQIPENKLPSVSTDSSVTPGLLKKATKENLPQESLNTMNENEKISKTVTDKTLINTTNENSVEKYLEPVIHVLPQVSNENIGKYDTETVENSVNINRTHTLSDTTKTPSPENTENKKKKTTKDMKVIRLKNPGF